MLRKMEHARALLRISYFTLPCRILLAFSGGFLVVPTIFRLFIGPITLNLLPVFVGFEELLLEHAQKIEQNT